MRLVEFGVLGLLVVILVSGGACVRLASPIPLEERAAAYWRIQATGEEVVVSSGKKVRLYDEFVSSVSKARMNETAYLRRQTLDIADVRIIGVEIDTDGIHGTVSVSFNTRMRGVWLKGVRTKEDWILENGKWMVIVPEPRNPFRRKLL